MTDTLYIASPDQLEIAAARIIEHLPNHPIVALRGGMGAGKTTLIREIARQMGVLNDVTSPTFALVNQYETDSGQIINHFDFYRIERLEEAFDMGYEEYFFSGDVCLIEWPEKIEPLIPENALAIQIEITGPSSRIITIS